MTQVNQQTGFVGTGDVFLVVEERCGGTIFKAGDILELAFNDGTSCPQYRNLLTGDKHYYYTNDLQKLEQVGLHTVSLLPEGTEAIFLGYIPETNGFCHRHWGFSIGEKFMAGSDGFLVGESGKSVSMNWGFKLAILPTKAAQTAPTESTVAPEDGKGPFTQTDYCISNGYEVGDHFEVLEDGTFDAGSIIELYEDDGTNCPLFKLVSGTCYTSAGIACYKMAGRVRKIIQEGVENVEELSYCEENGYKVGDKFLVTDGTLFDNGSVVELIEDDGSTCPLFRLVSGRCRYPDGKAYATIADCMTKIEEVENVQVEAPATVEQKRDRIIVISGLIANLQAEEAELRAQLRAAGFQLIEPEVASAIPDGVSVTDYRTWQKGDIVRCTTKQGKGTATLTVGGEYTIVCIDSDGDRYITDDDGDDVYYCVKSCFEFVRRP